MFDEKEIARVMNSLDVSREEAIEILKDDDAIDHGENLFELSAEQKAVEKSMKQTGTRKRTAYDFKPRKRKENPTKAQIIEELSHFLANSIGIATENVAITNKERQIAFECAGNKYELTLVQKRPPKK